MSDIPTVTIPLNDVRRQYFNLKEELDVAVERVLSSGQYLYGNEVFEFEREFASYIGVSSCIGVANGTDALTLALIATGCSPGDQIITAANAGMYTTTAALCAYLQPRFADVDPELLTLSAATVEAAIGSATRVVVVTHLYGQLADIAPIAELTRSRGIALIEDCSQAIGAQRDGLMAGAWGDLATFSFYPTKNLGAAGDGGAVVTNDERLARRVRLLSQYGWVEKYRSVISGGRNSRLDELQAAMLRVKLPQVDEWNQRRREIALRYRNAGGVRLRILGSSGDDYVAHLCVAYADDRRRLQQALASQGVESGIHYPIPDHQQPVLAGTTAARVTLPVTERASKHVLTLPCFAEMTEDEVNRVCQAVQEC
jgi:dTDP-4-amino-4,6-dideoxygalactose transaminase